MMQGALIAVLLAVGFLGLAASRWTETSGQSYNDIRDRTAAEHLETVRHAAEAYVATTTQSGDDNPFENLAAGQSTEISVSTLAGAGFLPGWYSQSNPLGQQYHIAVRRDAGNSRLYGIIVTDSSTGRMAGLTPENAEMRASSMAAVSGQAGGRAMMEDGAMMLEGANQTWTENPSLYGSGVTGAVRRGSLAGMLDIQGGGYHWVRDNEQCDIGDAPEYFEPGAAEQAAVACPASCGTTKKYVPETCARIDWNYSYTVTCQNADNVTVDDSFCDAGLRPAAEGDVCCPGGTGGGCAGTGNLCRSPVSWEYNCQDYSACAWSITAWAGCTANPVWNASGFGACSNQCGAGTQTQTSWCTGTSGAETRTVTCTDTASSALSPPGDAECLDTASPAARPKPVDSQACTAGCDPAGEPPASQACASYASCSFAWDSFADATPSGCGDVTPVRTFSTCRRSDGTIMADSECTSRGLAKTQNLTPVHVIDACTYAFAAYTDATPSGCGNVTPVRTFNTCRRSDNVTVADSECTSRGQAKTQNLAQVYVTDACTYGWAGSSDATPAGCGWVTPVRTFSTCRRSDATNVADSECTSRGYAKTQNLAQVYVTGACTYGWAAYSDATPNGCGWVTPVRTFNTCRRSDATNVADSECTSRGYAKTQNLAQAYATGACSYAWRYYTVPNGCGWVSKTWHYCDRSDGTWVDDSECVNRVHAKVWDSEYNTAACSYRWRFYNTPNGCGWVNKTWHYCDRSDGAWVDDSYCVATVNPKVWGTEYNINSCGYNWRFYNVPGGCGDVPRTWHYCDRSDGAWVDDSECVNRVHPKVWGSEWNNATCAWRCNATSCNYQDHCSLRCTSAECYDTRDNGGRPWGWCDAGAGWTNFNNWVNSQACRPCYALMERYLWKIKTAGSFTDNGVWLTTTLDTLSNDKCGDEGNTTPCERFTRAAFINWNNSWAELRRWDEDDEGSTQSSHPSSDGAWDDDNKGRDQFRKPNCGDMNGKDGHLPDCWTISQQLSDTGMVKVSNNPWVQRQSEYLQCVNSCW